MLLWSCAINERLRRVHCDETFIGKGRQVLKNFTHKYQRVGERWVVHIIHIYQWRIHDSTGRQPQNWGHYFGNFPYCGSVGKEVSPNFCSVETSQIFHLSFFRFKYFRLIKLNSPIFWMICWHSSQWQRVSCRGIVNLLCLPLWVCKTVWPMRYFKTVFLPSVAHEGKNLFNFCSAKTHRVFQTCHSLEFFRLIFWTSS